MIFGYFILVVALVISAVSAFYSITGLTAIFAAAFWPIIIMGSALEIGKIATTVWLHKYWSQAALRYKMYLVPAVAVLMLITSMGIFGFLSKAHLDQAVPSGDVAAKVSLYDEKIQVQRENIKAARANLSQLDAAVNETMGRSTTEQGADKAVAIRRAQAKDRAKLMQEIDAAQNTITKLQEERAPLAAEQRKVEAEVGPVKYIAALIYDQGAAENSDLLERAVRWVIILIVSVFDPLALVLILAATQTVEWERSDKRAKTMDAVNDPQEEESNAEDTNILLDSPPPEDSIATPEEFFHKGQVLAQHLDAEDEQRRANEANKLLAEIETESEPEVFVEDPVVDNSVELDKLKQERDRLFQAHSHELERADTLALNYDELEQQANRHMVRNHELTHKIVELEAKLAAAQSFKPVEDEIPSQLDDVERPGDYLVDYIPDSEYLTYKGKTYSVNSFKENFPDLAAYADNHPSLQPAAVDFGTSFPVKSHKGDMFLRVDLLPSRLYKFNGNKWIEIDKDTTDSYAFNEEYIKHLAHLLSTGQCDVEDLTDAEQHQIENYLRENAQ